MVVLGGYALLLIAAAARRAPPRRDRAAAGPRRGARPARRAGRPARPRWSCCPRRCSAPLLAADPVGLAEPVRRRWRRLAPATPARHADLAGRGAGRGGRLRAGDARPGAAPRRHLRRRAGRPVPAHPARGAQRAGLDLALVGLAVLGWSAAAAVLVPAVGAARPAPCGIDPLLAAAPTLGVLAGAVLALRLLPPLTRLAERYVDRQALGAPRCSAPGRPAAARTPGRCCCSRSRVARQHPRLVPGRHVRSGRVVDQADHRVGADLRLVETTWFAPPDRAAAGRGAARASTPRCPAWREQPGPRRRMAPADRLVAIDTGGRRRACCGCATTWPAARRTRLAGGARPPARIARPRAPAG